MAIPINTPYVGIQTPSLQTVLALQGGPGVSVTTDLVNQKVTLSNSAFASAFRIAPSGSINNLDFGGAAAIFFSNASLINVNGLKAGTDGQVVHIYALGTGEVDLVHNSGNAFSPTKLSNRVTSGVTPLAAGVGGAIYQFDGSANVWRLLVAEQGDYIDIPFNAGNFTANNAMTWTVVLANQITYCYYLKDRRLQVIAYIDSTTVGGTLDSQLRIATPSYTISRKVQGLALGFDNGTGIPTYNRLTPGTSYIEIGKSDSTNWSASTTNTFVRAHVEYGVT